MFRVMVKIQDIAAIKYFCCDLGDEYTSNKLSYLLAYDNTIHQTSCIDTPYQNDIAERKHRYIFEIAHSLFFCRLQFQVSFGVKKSVKLYMSLI